MPTYEYRCEACGHEYERVEKITKAPHRKCPNCGKLKSKRMLSGGAGLIFKGDGFYCTDYKRNKPKGTDKKPGKSEEKGKPEGGRRET